MDEPFSNLRSHEAICARLTPRESEVLALVGAGFGNREIALALAIGIGTVKSHVHNLLTKTNSSSRGELARLATTPQEPTPRSDPEADA